MSDHRKQFLAKNGSSSSSSPKLINCRIISETHASSSLNQEDTILTLECDCEEAHFDDNLKALQEALDRKKNKTNRPPKTSQENLQQLAQAKSLIHELVVSANKKKKDTLVHRFRPTANHTGRRLAKWIDLVDGLLVYKFNIIITDMENVNMDYVNSIMLAVEKDLRINYAKEYGKCAVFNLYNASGMSDPSLFQGDRIAIFIGNYSNGAFHYVNTPDPANKFSFPVGGGSLKGYNIELPEGSNFEYVPYSVLSSNDVHKFMGGKDNIYAISQYTLPKDAIQDPFHQIIATAFTHEVKEILSNDTTLNWVLFDHYAPTVAHWHWGEFQDPADEYRCTNSEKNPETGYYEVPLFLEKYPLGGLLFAVKEVGDVVSASFAALLNSYLVDGWLIQNHPLDTFWQPYNHSPELKYDHIGHVKRPMEPYGGLHQLVFFISYDDGITYLLEVQNKGPVTAEMRGAHKKNNFPPDYVVVRVLNVIEKNTNAISLIESVENYGPSTPDRT